MKKTLGLFIFSAIAIFSTTANAEHYGIGDAGEFEIGTSLYNGTLSFEEGKMLVSGAGLFGLDFLGASGRIFANRHDLWAAVGIQFIPIDGLAMHFGAGPLLSLNDLESSYRFYSDVLIEVPHFEFVQRLSSGPKDPLLYDLRMLVFPDIVGFGLTFSKENGFGPRADAHLLFNDLDWLRIFFAVPFYKPEDHEVDARVIFGAILGV